MSILENRDGGWDDWEVLIACVSGILRNAGTDGRTDTQIAAVLSQSVPTVQEAIEELCRVKRAHWSMRDGKIIAWHGPLVSGCRRGPSMFVGFEGPKADCYEIAESDPNS